MDRLSVAAKGREKRLMVEHFMLSSRYEFLFWEQAYRMEKWPL
jgi:thiaminase/transcriptional activator TenA